MIFDFEFKIKMLLVISVFFHIYSDFTQHTLKITPLQVDYTRPICRPIVGRVDRPGPSQSSSRVDRMAVDSFKSIVFNVRPSYCAVRTL